jgi:hypothetical protein
MDLQASQNYGSNRASLTKILAAVCFLATCAFLAGPLVASQPSKTVLDASNHFAKQHAKT